ncbi:putative iojap-related protein [Helicobacter cinaedi PAGU611]|uniref:Ribosomal silencing factor RsfS n=1 Tax=Helicobacter cinaedi CCUG 18818 = ATCC BAA-847 TaxID=537971 RepID=A0AAI8MLE9_9HELI|nr:ribosome silencing factor [Helicobacter cinaedi]AWK61339.1 ribosome silencing factor [Helicobacter cinaedi]EFR47102.1 iojap-like protein [Helicobacter cinaedi CCUG 18818 = ATCC BAA-847]QOQ90078.1 ribosome silencing factor [Helicobacter cinaedi]QOQ96259.1 ribosome silencing factor [Helicobacter cinaedi]BAM11796.1 putative iojap-related protein [Helicobacter cinaedi PAGU611]
MQTDSIKTQLTISERLQHIQTLLEDKKGEDIEIFDLSGRDYIVDKVVIVSAMIGRHSFALLDHLKTELKPQGEIFYATEEESDDWLIADLGDIMIHIFTPNHRKRFNLEEFLNTIINDKARLES